MIKILLKHIIYEICIEKIFNSIQENFHIFNTDISDASVGDCFSLIIPVENGNNKIKLFICKVLYKKKKNLVIGCYDNLYPIYLIVKNKTIVNLTSKELMNYEEYF